MTEEELDRDCSDTFVILHRGWELDNKGWVMRDGSVFTTSHTRAYEMDAADIKLKIREAELSLAGLKYALAATKRKAVTP